MVTFSDVSVAEERLFIKEFEFRKSLGFNVYEEVGFSDSDKIRLSFSENIMRLKRDSTTGYFPTDTDIWFRTWVTNPLALRELMMVQVFAYSPEGTSYQVRLYDGTDHYYWNGISWVVAGTSDWNTEAEINANIGSFNVLPNRRFAIVVNLITTDKYITPYVREIRVLMKLKISYLDDIIFRSLINKMSTDIRPVGNFPLPAVTSDTTEIDLNNYNLDTNFNITDIDSVYDYSSDSELLYDILDSYNPTTKIITLSSTILSGNIPFIIFKYAPKIVYTTDQDYIEVASIPSIVLQRLEVPTSQSYSKLAEETIIDRGTYDGYKVKEPWRATIQFRVHCENDKSTDQMRMMEALLQFFDDNELLRSVGIDEYYRMYITKEMRDLISPTSSGQLTFWTVFTIDDIRMPFVAEAIKGRQRLILKFSEPDSKLEDPVIGGSELVFSGHDDDMLKKWEEIFNIEE